jgi:hypothetical protein
VVGTFRGTLDGTGRIELGTLTYFEIHQTGFASPSFMENMFIGVHSAPDFFTFNPSTPATFGFHVALNTIALPLTAEFCMGPAIGLFCAGSGSARGVGTLDGVPALISTSAPTLTLISATPLPGALLLFGTALSGIAGLSLVRRRRSL